MTLDLKTESNSRLNAASALRAGFCLIASLVWATGCQSSGATEDQSGLVGYLVLIVVLLFTAVFFWRLGRARRKIKQQIPVNEELAQADPDREALDRLEQAKSDLSKPHNIEFFLYFPTKTAASDAATRIELQGFKTRVTRAGKGADWLCFVTKPMIPEHAALLSIRNSFEALASSLDGEYDGWGARVVKAK
jgi:hypothetical protein